MLYTHLVLVSLKPRTHPAVSYVLLLAWSHLFVMSRTAVDARARVAVVMYSRYFLAAYFVASYLSPSRTLLFTHTI